MLAHRAQILLPARTAALAAITLALAFGAPAPALAGDDGDKDVRVKGTCGKGATSQLRITAKDGAIQVEFEVHSKRGGERWRVVLVHERRVVWRGRARTRSGSRSFRIRRSIPDFAGADQVTARASGRAATRVKRRQRSRPPERLRSRQSPGWGEADCDAGSTARRARPSGRRDPAEHRHRAVRRAW